MKAARWHGRRDVRIEEVAEPILEGDYDVKVGVDWAGISGTDMAEFTDGPIFIPLKPHPLTKTCAPQILGHEFGGTVVETGKKVRSVKVGDLVSVNPMISCGKCYWCKQGRPMFCDVLAYRGLLGDGGFAEYVVAGEGDCVVLKPGIPKEYSAFGEPVGVCIHAVNQALVGGGETVAIVGSGLIGLMLVQMCRLQGARKIIVSGLVKGRREMAKKLGADEVLDPASVSAEDMVKELTGGRGVDIVFETVGGKRKGILGDTAVAAVSMCRPRGQVVIIGVFDEPSSFHFANILFYEKVIKGSWTFLPDEFRQGINFISEGKIKIEPLISRKIGISQLVDVGFPALEFDKENNIKILLSPKGAE